MTKLETPGKKPPERVSDSLIRLNDRYKQEAYVKQLNHEDLEQLMREIEERYATEKKDVPDVFKESWLLKAIDERIDALEAKTQDVIEAKQRCKDRLATLKKTVGENKSTFEKVADTIVPESLGMSLQGKKNTVVGVGIGAALLGIVAWFSRRKQRASGERSLAQRLGTGWLVSNAIWVLSIVGLGGLGYWYLNKRFGDQLEKAKAEMKEMYEKGKEKTKEVLVKEAEEELLQVEEKLQLGRYLSLRPMAEVLEKKICLLPKADEQAFLTTHRLDAGRIVRGRKNNREKEYTITFKDKQCTIIEKDLLAEEQRKSPYGQTAIGLQEMYREDANVLDADSSRRALEALLEQPKVLELKIQSLTVASRDAWPQAKAGVDVLLPPEHRGNESYQKALYFLSHTCEKQKTLLTGRVDESSIDALTLGAFLEHTGQTIRTFGRMRLAFQNRKLTDDKDFVAGMSETFSSNTLFIDGKFNGLHNCLKGLGLVGHEEKFVQFCQSSRKPLSAYVGGQLTSADVPNESERTTFSEALRRLQQHVKQQEAFLLTFTHGNAQCEQVLRSLLPNVTLIDALQIVQFLEEAKRGDQLPQRSADVQPLGAFLLQLKLIELIAREKPELGAKLRPLIRYDRIAAGSEKDSKISLPQESKDVLRILGGTFKSPAETGKEMLREKLSTDIIDRLVVLQYDVLGKIPGTNPRPKTYRAEVRTIVELADQVDRRGDLVPYRLILQCKDGDPTAIQAAFRALGLPNYRAEDAVALQLLVGLLEKFRGVIDKSAQRLGKNREDLPFADVLNIALHAQTATGAFVGEWASSVKDMKFAPGSLLENLQSLDLSHMQDKCKQILEKPDMYTNEILITAFSELMAGKVDLSDEDERAKFAEDCKGFMSFALGGPGNVDYRIINGGGKLAPTSTPMQDNIARELWKEVSTKTAQETCDVVCNLSEGGNPDEVRRELMRILQDEAEVKVRDAFQLYYLSKTGSKFLLAIRGLALLKEHGKNTLRIAQEAGFMRKVLGVAYDVTKGIPIDTAMEVFNLPEPMRTEVRNICLYYVDELKDKFEEIDAMLKETSGLTFKEWLVVGGAGLAASALIRWSMSARIRLATSMRNYGVSGKMLDNFSDPRALWRRIFNVDGIGPFKNPARSWYQFFAARGLLKEAPPQLANWAVSMKKIDEGVQILKDVCGKDPERIATLIREAGWTELDDLVKAMSKAKLGSAEDVARACYKAGWTNLDDIERALNSAGFKDAAKTRTLLEVDVKAGKLARPGTSPSATVSTVDDILKTLPDELADAVKALPDEAMKLRIGKILQDTPELANALKGMPKQQMSSACRVLAESNDLIRVIRAMPADEVQSILRIIGPMDDVARTQFLARFSGVTDDAARLAFLQGLPKATTPVAPVSPRPVVSGSSPLGAVDDAAKMMPKARPQIPQGASKWPMMKFVGVAGGALSMGINYKSLLDSFEVEREIRNNLTRELLKEKFFPAPGKEGFWQRKYGDHTVEISVKSAEELKNDERWRTAAALLVDAGGVAAILFASNPIGWAAAAGMIAINVYNVSKGRLSAFKAIEQMPPWLVGRLGSVGSVGQAEYNLLELSPWDLGFSEASPEVRSRLLFSMFLRAACKNPTCAQFYAPLLESPEALETFYQTEFKTFILPRLSLEIFRQGSFANYSIEWREVKNLEIHGSVWSKRIAFESELWRALDHCAMAHRNHLLEKRYKEARAGLKQFPGDPILQAIVDEYTCFDLGSERQKEFYRQREVVEKRVRDHPEDRDAKLQLDLHRMQEVRYVLLRDVYQRRSGDPEKTSEQMWTEGMWQRINTLAVDHPSRGGMIASMDAPPRPGLGDMRTRREIQRDMLFTLPPEAIGKMARPSDFVDGTFTVANGIRVREKQPVFRHSEEQEGIDMEKTYITERVIEATGGRTSFPIVGTVSLEEWPGEGGKQMKVYIVNDQSTVGPLASPKAGLRAVSYVPAFVAQYGYVEPVEIFVQTCMYGEEQGTATLRKRYVYKWKERKDGRLQSQQWILGSWVESQTTEAQAILQRISDAKRIQDEKTAAEMETKRKEEEKRTNDRLDSRNAAIEKARRTSEYAVLVPHESKESYDGEYYVAYKGAVYALKPSEYTEQKGTVKATLVSHKPSFEKKPSKYFPHLQLWADEVVEEYPPLNPAGLVLKSLDADGKRVTFERWGGSINGFLDTQNIAKEQKDLYLHLLTTPVEEEKVGAETSESILRVLHLFPHQEKLVASDRIPQTRINAKTQLYDALHPIYAPLPYSEKRAFLIALVAVLRQEGKITIENESRISAHMKTIVERLRMTWQKGSELLRQRGAKESTEDGHVMYTFEGEHEFQGQKEVVSFRFHGGKWEWRANVAAGGTWWPAASLFAESETAKLPEAAQKKRAEWNALALELSKL